MIMKLLIIIIAFILPCRLYGLVVGVSDPPINCEYEQIVKWCAEIPNAYFIDRYVDGTTEIIHASRLHFGRTKSSEDAVYLKLNTGYKLLKKYRYVSDLLRKCIVSENEVIVVQYGNFDNPFEIIDKISY